MLRLYRSLLMLANRNEKLRTQCYDFLEPKILPVNNSPNNVAAILLDSLRRSNRIGDSI
jgi:hypothetical protein